MFHLSGFKHQGAPVPTSVRVGSIGHRLFAPLPLQLSAHKIHPADCDTSLPETRHDATRDTKLTSRRPIIHSTLQSMLQSARQRAQRITITHTLTRHRRHGMMCAALWSRTHTPSHTPTCRRLVVLLLAAQPRPAARRCLQLLEIMPSTPRSAKREDTQHTNDTNANTTPAHTHTRTHARMHASTSTRTRTHTHTHTHTRTRHGKRPIQRLQPNWAVASALPEHTRGGQERRQREEAEAVCPHRIAHDEPDPGSFGMPHCAGGRAKLRRHNQAGRAAGAQMEQVARARTRGGRA